ncbi:MAG: pyrroloquinoline quinone biosynthesis protein PqqE, partial [Pseudomonas sp.]|nr:pyrroloquinoline quinone biosynthesis protein PqqE [Pseudomonas sp.]
SAHHGVILAARQQSDEAPLGLDALQYRNEKASRIICKA